MRNAIHLVASVLMWALFGWYWYIVIEQRIGPESWRAVAVLAVVSALGLLGTLAWVAHNKRVAARNRRRGAPPAPDEHLVTDHLGRPLAGESPDALRTAKVVTVAVDAQGRKVLARATGVRD